MGDFNAVTRLDEKAGGRRYGTRSSEDFCNFIVDNGLIDVGFSGNKFTWCNNQSGNNCIWMRLDRVLINGAGAGQFPRMKVVHLPRVKSDHCPLLVSFTDSEMHQSYFSFNSAWLKHEGFIPFVRSSWSNIGHGNAMESVQSKLKVLRGVLRSWNWNVFGDFNQKISDLSKRIEDSEGALLREWSEELEKDIRFLNSRLHSALDDRYYFLEAKSHIKWLADGDRNSKLFHAASKVRRAANSFRVTLDDGSVSDDRDEMGSKAVFFFHDLLGRFSASPDRDYFDDIVPSITSLDNDLLTKIPNADEIWAAVQNLPKDSAPGPDGFNGSFFQSCWDIVGDDVVKAVSLFFKGFALPSSMSSTVLTLIPKVRGATSLDQVRPISLCNFTHKIISRILNDRVRPLLSKIISEEQFGFIPGRSIHQCIALAHDLASDIHNKVHGGNIMAKLDMSKAYDRLSWVFLIRALRSMGFSEGWCDLIYRNISNCWYSIRVRGKSFGHFKSNRGLRQGDPLSPTLFIIAMEILSRKLNSASKPGGGIMPYWSSLRALEINHILYADDILVFSNGGKQSFTNLMHVLDAFCANSGQVLQPSKCKLFMSKHISNVRKADLLRISGYSLGNFPIRYLGAPLFPGAPRLSYFQNLVDSIKDRIQGWSKSFLSMAGRLTMIKSVLSSIPIHTLSVLQVPKGVLHAIDKLMRSYLWGGGTSTKRHWVKWDSICTDVKAGGLGIRPLHHMMIALRGKFAWKYLCNDSLWSKHARSRFSIGGKGSHLWRNISPFITSIALDCRWNLGNGSTPTGIFCHNLALPCPKSLRPKPIKEVLNSADLRRMFLHNMNPRVLQSLGGNMDPEVPDNLIWAKHSSGIVSTRSFLDTFAPANAPVRMFEIIWQPWLPPKVSCFLWRILHRALPTNDNVMRIGIPLASKCFCCNQPHCETMEHLFISGNMASSLWGFLCPLFRKAKPISLRGFFHDWGISAKFNSFSNLFGFGLACLCLWEIWKIRNSKVFDDGNLSFSKSTIIRCAYSLAKCVPHKCHYDLRARSICRILCISAPPSRKFSVFWCPWYPVRHGPSCNVAIHTDGNSSKMSAIIRCSRGLFLYGLKVTTTSKPFIKCLFHLICELQRIGLKFVRLQASHEEVCLLGRDSAVDWSLFQLKRKLAVALHQVSIFRVSFSLNYPAEVLCFSNIERLSSPIFDSLPNEVKFAIVNDGSPHPCSTYDFRIYT